MPLTSEALAILLVLLPGFSCAYIVDKLAVRRKQTELDKVIEALLFSFLIYLGTSPLFNYSLPLNWQRTLSGAVEQYSIKLNWPYLVVMAAFAFILSILYSANLNHDWLLKVLRYLRVTQRTARNSIWNDAFQDIPSTYVMVQLSGERSLIGYVRYYADDSEDASLFLEDAAWIVDGDGTQQPVDGAGILLTRLSGIESVTFLNSTPLDPARMPAR